jgi:hypothetical protein
MVSTIVRARSHAASSAATIKQCQVRHVSTSRLLRKAFCHTSIARHASAVRQPTHKRSFHLNQPKHRVLAAYDHRPTQLLTPPGLCRLVCPILILDDSPASGGPSVRGEFVGEANNAVGRKASAHHSYQTFRLSVSRHIDTSSSELLGKNTGSCKIAE